MEMPDKGEAMDRLIQVERARLASEMQKEVQGMLAQVMDAVNAAQDGRLIEDSERAVLELMRDFQKRVFEKALQLRVDSTESAFSPSPGPGGQAPAQQRPLRSLASDAAGACKPAAQTLLRRGRRKSGAGGPAGGSGRASDQLRGG
jgi:hypothetical protein